MAEILSDDEIKAAVRPLYSDCIAFEMAWPDMVLPEARAVERAVIKRLAEMGGELPEPDHGYHARTGYTADQMRAHYARGVAAGMAQERARCVAVCDELAALLRTITAGYAGSVMVGSDDGSVTLHYESSAHAEAAHAALTDYIDALAAKEQTL